MSTPCLSAAEPKQDRIIAIDGAELTESSGLARSQRLSGYFWTHNDSGDRARLFALNTEGLVTGSIELAGADAIDWEDLASFNDRGTHQLLVGDIGDNNSTRDSITFYQLDEPNPATHATTSSFKQVRARYPDGPRDAEAIAVDIRRRRLLIITKSLLRGANVYALGLDQFNQVDSKTRILNFIGTISVPLVTAADMNEATEELWLATYLQLFRFEIPEPQPARPSWFNTRPRTYDLPRMKQIEALALDSDGNLWVTSEGSPATLAQVEVIDESKP